MADVVALTVQNGRFPVVLGGDCSILLGAMLALRRTGRYGLFFVGGHTDFNIRDPRGEVASMELALISGHGPKILSDMDGLRPLAEEKDIVGFGHRDAEAEIQEGGEDIRETTTLSLDLPQAREPNVAEATAHSVQRLVRDDLAGFWIHLDADVLDDAVMPAVDYRTSDGLPFEELTTVLQTLLATDRAVGMTVTIFNPVLDDDGGIARRLTDCIVAGLTGK